MIANFDVTTLFASPLLYVSPASNSSSSSSEVTLMANFQTAIGPDYDTLYNFPLSNDIQIEALAATEDDSLLAITFVCNCYFLVAAH